MFERQYEYRSTIGANGKNSLKWIDLDLDHLVLVRLTRIDPCAEKKIGVLRSDEIDLLRIPITSDEEYLGVFRLFLRTHVLQKKKA